MTKNGQIMIDKSVPWGKRTQHPKVADEKEDRFTHIDLRDRVDSFLAKYNITNYYTNSHQLYTTFDYKIRLAESRLPEPVQRFFYLRHLNLLQLMSHDIGDEQGQLWAEHVKPLILYSRAA